MQNIVAQKKVKNLDLTAEVVTVTPHIAKQWLDSNTKNRKLKKSFVSRLASDIRDGNWRLTGDAIKFAVDGALLDGQHRLAACIQADRPITTFVVYGVPNEVQSVMDIGVPRSAADVLGMEHITNANNVASACRFLYNEKRGIVPFGGHAAVTTSQILAVLKKHPRLPLYVPNPGKMPRGISIPAVGYIRYVVSTFCGKAIDADAMMKVLQTGVPSYEGDAIHAYREKIMRASGDKSLLSGADRSTMFNTLKHCWNLFVDQEPVKILRLVKEPTSINGLDLKDL